jgi:hypothetical protein
LKVQEELTAKTGSISDTSIQNFLESGRVSEREIDSYEFDSECAFLEKLGSMKSAYHLVEMTNFSKRMNKLIIFQLKYRKIILFLL